MNQSHDLRALFNSQAIIVGSVNKDGSLDWLLDVDENADTLVYAALTGLVATIQAALAENMLTANVDADPSDLS